MKKGISLLLIMLFAFLLVHAQVDKEQQELEKQRQILKKELEEKQNLLDKNRKRTKESMSTLALINSKVNLQERVIDNISRDINLLDNKISRSQHDVRKLSLLLDTLKQEYAKSMIYSYKNRGNADFLNFLFSASSFNDAIKRINYLKSYRNYRALQGENIIHTQDLLRGRINELSDNKQQKDVALQSQSKEMDVLAQQQKEKDEAVKRLKAEGKELNKQIAAKKKQMQKVSNAIAAAIKRAQEEARKEALAKAELERRKQAEALKNKSNEGKNTTIKPNIVAKPVTKPVSVLLATDEDVKLNANFESNRGGLPWPVSKGYVIMGFGLNVLPNKLQVDNPGLTIGSDIGTPVKAVFDGEVSSVTDIEDMQVVILKHGRYFSTYSNLTGVNLSRGQMVRTGQVIGRVAANDEGIGSIDLIISNENGNLDPQRWLKSR